MVQEKQLKELFKYIEQNWDVCISQVDKTDIKRIFGGVLCEDIMNETDQVIDQVTDQEQPALNPIEQAYERGEKIRRKDWNINSYTRKYDLSTKKQFTWHGERINPEEWELYTEPTKQPAQPSSQVKLDNSFDRERFERMFCIFASRGSYLNFEQIKNSTEHALKQLDAYYASKKGGSNE